jgi:hypothetical protein
MRSEAYRPFACLCLSLDSAASSQLKIWVQSCRDHSRTDSFLTEQSSSNLQIPQMILAYVLMADPSKLLMSISQFSIGCVQDTAEMSQNDTSTPLWLEKLLRRHRPYQSVKIAESP